MHIALQLAKILRCGNLLEVRQGGIRCPTPSAPLFEIFADRIQKYLTRAPLQQLFHHRSCFARSGLWVFSSSSSAFVMRFALPARFRKPYTF